MRVIPLCRAVGVGMALLAGPRPASAQAPSDVQALQVQIEQLKKEFAARWAPLEARLAAVQTAPPAAATAAASAEPAPVTQAPAAASASKVFNPDIAVIGDFLGAAGRNAVSPSP